MGNLAGRGVGRVAVREEGTYCNTYYNVLHIYTNTSILITNALQHAMPDILHEVLQDILQDAMHDTLQDEKHKTHNTHHT